MEIQDFIAQVNSWPRNQRGRLILSVSKKEVIGRMFSQSGLTLVNFCEATGLKMATVSKISKDAKKEIRKKRSVKLDLFRQVKVIPTQNDPIWHVCGPNGLQVECQNLSQLVQLWRALC